MCILNLYSNKLLEKNKTNFNGDGFQSYSSRDRDEHSSTDQLQRAAMQFPYSISGIQKQNPNLISSLIVVEV